MNFNQMVVRNTLRNRHLYLAYFLSTMFAVMVFFTFTVFAFHPALGNDLNSYVKQGMKMAAVIIYGFAFFFVLYSMDVFIQSRKKEFGVLMIQGMSPKQLKHMVFVENLVIGFFATICGSLLGIVFSQFILRISKWLMRIDLGFYFPASAFAVTMISFLVLFFLISVFIRFRLPKMSLQELLKAGEMGKGSLKPSTVKAFLSVLLIGAGYAVALVAKGIAVIAVMFPVIAVVIVGTRYFFNQLSVGVIDRLRKKQPIFWKKTNMIVFSDLAFRMKDNARSFFLVSVISTVAFAAIGTLYGLENILVGQFDRMPYEIEIAGVASAKLDSQAELIDQTLADQQITAKKAHVTVYQDDSNQSFMTISQYNELAEVTGEEALKNDGKVIQLMAEDAPQAAKAQSAVALSGSDIKVAEKVQSRAVPAYGTYFAVPDSTDFSQLSANEQYFWNPKDAAYDQMVKAGKLLYQKDAAIQGKTFMRQTMIDAYAPVLFVGIFIGIVFFVSAGSFLYFRLYSDMDVDVEKFRMIFKLGLSKKELKKMIYQQVGILFFTPILVSFIHGAVALTAMYHILNQGMQMAGWEVLGVFILIQIVYYLIARVFYFRKVYRQVTA